MTTTVIHIRDRQPGDVYIGRAGKGEDGTFGNPFSLGRDGNRAQVIQMFKLWFLGKIATDSGYRQRVRALRGKRLCCFCVPKPWTPADGGPTVCHGQVMANWLNSQPDNQKEA